MWIIGSSMLIGVDAGLGVVLGLAPIGLYMIVKYSVARLLVVVVGGMLVLGSSSDISAAKLLYAPLVVV
ncbi:hypothetical protein, partial [Microbacterium schleiferi]|uniref:hypothetical protein n=1 Tax=Microbacterium schleiferi TaxID=69362 RepID=UPI0035C7A66B